MADRNFASSDKGTPCPICTRDKDGDCRISGDLILCRIGSSHRPPTEKAGTQVTGKDGHRWICRGPAADAGWIQFALAGSCTNIRDHRSTASPIKPPAAMAAIAGSADLARLPASPAMATPPPGGKGLALIPGRCGMRPKQSSTAAATG